jgi:hypothetical protein
VIWLVAWGVLHRRWRARTLAGRAIERWAALLLALGVLFAFPPVWGLVS